MSEITFNGTEISVETAINMAFDAGSVAVIDLFLNDWEKKGEAAIETLVEFREFLIDSLNQAVPGAGQDVNVIYKAVDEQEKINVIQNDWDTEEVEGD
jgi:hypothetical protein